MFCRLFNPRKKSTRPIQLTLLITILPLILQILTLNNVAEAASYDEVSESHYDPERETDGMPRVVGASRSLSQPLFKMTQGGGDSEADDNEQQVTMPNRKSSLRKRSDDHEQEDDVDDEDRDEDKSGSSQHDSYESPAFGESRKAAQDGEDIERFFDTHLGPQEPAPAESSSGSNPSTVLPARDDTKDAAESDSSNVKLDSPEDQYVAAASSPLSDIFHTLIKAHRRPIVIHATEEAPRGSATNINGAVQPPQQQQQESSVAPTSTDSVTSLVGAVPVPMPLDHSTAAGIIQAAASAAVAPLTLFAPLASHPSPLPTSSGYEPLPDASSGAHGNAAADEQSTPVRVYIARRPSFIQHFRALAPAVASASSGHRLIQQSSDAHWRGLHAPRYVQMNQRPPHAAYDESQTAEYARYPMMSNSYSHPREYMPTAHDTTQASAAAAAAPGDDESGTVSYNLSFGGAASTAAAPEEDSASNGQQEVNYRQQQMSSNSHRGYPNAYAQHQQPQQQSYGAGYSPVHYSSRNRHPSSTQTHNNYYQQSANGAFNQRGQRGGNTQVSGPMRDQPAYNQQYQGSRFHKDVSESGAQPLNYVQVYSNNQIQPNSNMARMATMKNGLARDRWNHHDRQRLLASLDEEIKSSPYYKQDATSPAQLYAQRSALNLHQKSKSRLGQNGGDDAELVSYNLFHSETDPQKSFTASSELVTEPEPDTSIRRGSHKAPNTNTAADNGKSARDKKESNSSHVSRTKNGNNDEDNVQSATATSTTTKEHQQQPQQSNHKQQQQQQQSDANLSSSSKNLVTGPLTKDNIELHRLQQSASSGSGIVALRCSPQSSQQPKVHHRVRREDADDREAEDADDDGVWVDDDEDDDNKQTASDLNETTQEPLEGDDDLEGDQEQAGDATTGSNQHMHHHSGIVGGPHSYELANDR